MKVNDQWVFSSTPNNIYKVIEVKGEAVLLFSPTNWGYYSSIYLEKCILMGWGHLVKNSNKLKE